MMSAPSHPVSEHCPAPVAFWVPLRGRHPFDPGMTGKDVKMGCAATPFQNRPRLQPPESGLRQESSKSLHPSSLIKASPLPTRFCGVLDAYCLRPFPVCPNIVPSGIWIGDRLALPLIPLAEAKHGEDRFVSAWLSDPAGRATPDAADPPSSDSRLCHALARQVGDKKENWCKG